MAYNFSKIELGAGNLSVSVLGTENPPGTDVGGTDGAELTYAGEFLDIEIDQTMGPVVSYMIGEEGLFKCTIVEQQMRSISMALHLDPLTTIYSQPTYQRIVFGSKRSPVYLYLTYECEQAADTSKKWYFRGYRTRTMSGLTMTFAKKERRAMDVTFKLFPDSAASPANALGEIEWEV